MERKNNREDIGTPEKRTIAEHLRSAAITTMLFVFALIPRLSAAWQGFITPDEPFWVFSSIRFLRALETQHWVDTFQIGHPGVTTMWVGTLSVLWQRSRDAVGTAAHLAWVDHVPWIAPENAELFPHLLPFLPSARVMMAILTSLGIGGCYVLGRRLFDRRVALLAAILLAFDPFTVGLSGLLHVDALATTFATLSLLAWLIAMKEEQGRFFPTRSWFALLSGLCAGLGILSKLPIAFIAIFIPVSALLFFLGSPSRHKLKQIALLSLIWGVAATVAVFAAFPGMWQDPVGMVRKIYGLATRYQAEAHEITFFRGASGGDPGIWFYPTAFLFRLMPPTLIGLLLSAFPLFFRARSTRNAPSRGRDGRRVVMGSLWAFVVGFTILLTLGAKKFDRYLLPTFPSLNVLSAIGWVSALDGVVRWSGGHIPFTKARDARRTKTFTSEEAFVTLLISLLLAQAAMLFNGWPYYLDAYNPLTGGMKTALHTLPVGWGEGLEQIAEYVNSQPNAASRVITGGSPVTLGPLVQGTVLILDESSRRLADNILITALDRQIAPSQSTKLVSGASLEHVVRAGGQEILWLYKTNFRTESAHLERYVAPGDVVLCDVSTPFTRQNPGIEVLESADEPEIVDALNEWSAAHTRLWYLSYPAASPITRQNIRQQLETYAVRLDEIELNDGQGRYATAVLYILPDDPIFAPQSTDSSANPPGETQLAPGQVGLLPASFGSLVLSGAAALDQDITTDGAIRFALRWRAESIPLADYAVFIHLVDQAGHLRAAGRGDDLLVDKRFWPTSAWLAGNQVEWHYTIATPPGLPPGEYQILVGLSDVQTGAWVPTLNEENQIEGTTARALNVTLLPAKTLPDPEDLKLARSENIVWRNQLKLFGVDLAAQARIGEKIVVGLGWQSLNKLDDDYAIRLSLRRKDDQPSGGAPLGLEQTWPLSAYPTTAWRRGESIHEVYDLVLPAKTTDGRMLGTGHYGLSIEVLRAPDPNHPDGVRLSPPVEIGEIQILAEERVFDLPIPPQHVLDLGLGEPASLALIGYDLEGTELPPGRDLVVTLYWRCNTTVDTSYTVFVHLLDANGQVQGQSDRVPANGQAPTSGWVEGQIVVDRHTVAIVGSAQPGPHQLEVGMYDLGTMVRLPIHDANGQQLPDARALLDTEITLVGANGRD